eukprot:1997661-Lingulodinium_polyedra.AAC.1
MVIRALQENEEFDRNELMQMRWVVTWKEDEQAPAGQKLKARLVVVGYQDPALGEVEVASPT